MSDRTEISAEPPTPAARRLPQRYGAGRSRRRVVPIVLGTVLALALLAWALWAGTAKAAIDADVTSYHVVDDHRVEVRISATFRDEDVDGTCLVRATAEDHTIVGELNITADELRAAGSTWIPIRTERRATTAEVVRCTD